MGKARLSVEARAGESAAAEHLDYLGILLAVLLEAVIGLVSNATDRIVTRWGNEHTQARASLCRSRSYPFSGSFLPV
jgi:hypothetical protein